VDLAAGVVRLEAAETKGKAARVFPINAMPELRDLLRRQRERADALGKEHACVIERVFFRGAGRPIKNLYDSWRAACEAAGVPGRYLHDFRRTTARRLRRAGVAESDIMALCGWKTRSVFERYSVRNEADLAEAVAKAAAQVQADRKVPRSVVPLKTASEPPANQEPGATEANGAGA
jgi:integrase